MADEVDYHCLQAMYEATSSMFMNQHALEHLDPVDYEAIEKSFVTVGKCLGKKIDAAGLVKAIKDKNEAQVEEQAMKVDDQLAHFLFDDVS